MEIKCLPSLGTGSRASLSWWLYLKNVASSPKEKCSWIVKLARLGKDLYQKGKEVFYNHIFSKLNAPRKSDKGLQSVKYHSKA